MGSGNHNTGVCTIVPGGKAQSRYRHQRVIDPHPDSVGSQHTGCGSGKHIGIDPAVVGNGHQLIAALGLDPVGQALSCLTDNVNVHPVGACTQHAPQSGGAELQCHGKALFDLFILAFNGLQFLLQRRIFQVSLQPAAVIVHVHVNHPILYMNFRVFILETSILYGIYIGLSTIC